MKFVFGFYFFVVFMLIVSMPVMILWSQYAEYRSLKAAVAGRCDEALEWGARGTFIPYEVNQRCFRDK
jgi:hypothetical protein